MTASEVHEELNNDARISNPSCVRMLASILTVDHVRKDEGVSIICTMQVTNVRMGGIKEAMSVTAMKI